MTSADRGPVPGDVDERVWRRCRPFVEDALESQPEAARAAFLALLDDRRLRFDFERSDDRLWLVFGVVDAAEVPVPFVKVNAHNVGLWETDGGLVYLPDVLLDDDLPSMGPVGL